MSSQEYASDITRHRCLQKLSDPGRVGAADGQRSPVSGTSAAARRMPRIPRHRVHHTPLRRPALGATEHRRQLHTIQTNI